MKLQHVSTRIHALHAYMCAVKSFYLRPIILPLSFSLSPLDFGEILARAFVYAKQSVPQIDVEASQLFFEHINRINLVYRPLSLSLLFFLFT